MMEPSSVNVVIYHANCNDGFGAAYSAWKLLGNRAEYHAASHGSPPPDVTGKRVVILDFSYDNATTKALIAQAEVMGYRSPQIKHGRATRYIKHTL